jgi:hypothetical protein
MAAIGCQGTVASTIHPVMVSTATTHTRGAFLAQSRFDTICFVLQELVRRVHLVSKVVVH